MYRVAYIDFCFANINRLLAAYSDNRPVHSVPNAKHFCRMSFWGNLVLGETVYLGKAPYDLFSDIIPFIFVCSTSHHRLAATDIKIKCYREGNYIFNK